MMPEEGGGVADDVELWNAMAGCLGDGTEAADDAFGGSSGWVGR